MTAEKPINTAKLKRTENEETPTNIPLKPSTPYVNGSRYEIYLIQTGKFSNGNKAPDKKNNGKITKFIIKLNPCMSFIFEANINPKPMKVEDMSSIKITDSKNADMPAILNPIKIEIPRIKIP